MAPFAFIENDRVTEIPTVEKEWVRKGPAAESFEAIDVLPVLERKAVDYISAHAAGAKQGKPFFLYLPLASPHTPILPTKEWQGKSGLNPYGDFVMQTDATVGAVLEALETHGLTENTLVIFTSDNGVLASGEYPELLAKGPQSQLPCLSRHQGGYFRRRPSRSVYGSLAGASEGGHDQATSWFAQSDLFATCADILGKKLPDSCCRG
jgi:arylsulfatase A